MNSESQSQRKESDRLEKKNWFIAIFARPNSQLKAGLSLAAQKYFNKRVHPRNLLNGVNPRWSMQIGPQVNMSSTQLRADN